MQATIDVVGGKTRGISKLIGEASHGELHDVPPGVNNSLAWLVRHAGEICWLSAGIFGGRTIPWRPADPGIPIDWRALAAWEAGAREPTGDVDGLQQFIGESHTALADALCAPTATLEDQLDTPSGRHSGWWTLDLMVTDVSYHFGQANYLLRMMRGRSREGGRG